MNSAVTSVPSRRRYWPWVLAFCLAPIVILGGVAYSFLALDRDAAALRKQVMGATKADWQTKVQISAGRLTLGAVRAGLSFVDRAEIQNARLALSSVSRVSVGVYQRDRREDDAGSRQSLCAETDNAMNRRGWSRLVGVVNGKEAVLIYVPKKYSADGPVDLCLSVLSERQLVVVATTVSADGLADLVKRHADDGWRRELKLTKF